MRLDAAVDEEIRGRIDRGGIDAEVPQHLRRGDVELRVGPIVPAEPPRESHGVEHARVADEEGTGSGSSNTVQRNHGRVVECARELLDAGAETTESSERIDGCHLSVVAGPEVHTDLPV